MIQFDLPKEKSSIIKVIGIGGGGSNAVSHMYSQHIENVNFIICNTDAQAIALSEVPNKIQLGPHLTQGLGAGANPEIGRQATEESLEEIKRILEVNTKMAFVTAGMGGGTGTGGAPIISKICKDLGILTVGIVTTPFSYEGKKRQLQAEEGIKNLKQYVDTLLVISNDKLRHQFGNLRMKDAFAKADNVLATAAKCITDVINSTGQINVDFADVCTVMRNGGVAILGNAACHGENRAQRAIEEALNSPLLNDNEIRGAKWILININSAEGEHEFTMDEVDIIQNHLISQAGENTDVILGLGYDNNLGEKIGITLIATGFDYNDPFMKKETVKPQVEQQLPKKEEKIVMRLADPADEKKAKAPEPIEPVDPLAPKLIEEPAIIHRDDEAHLTRLHDSSFDLQMLHDEEEQEANAALSLQFRLKEEVQQVPVDEEKLELERKKRQLEEKFANLHRTIIQNPSGPTGGVSNGGGSTSSYVSRPAVYEAKASVAAARPAEVAKMEEEENIDMQLVIRNDIPVAADQKAAQNQMLVQEDLQDAAVDQKRRAAERLQKLRNLSFNVNAADPNNEFETVPAYIRRNMELFNNSSSVENFYSNYSVKSDGKSTQISTINTFLDGKKPD
ncbi:cell division protein FtsZ [Paraflavisolibacter sp. H34]|uniref:cell division protein FtsZ n=1 Tax=Huijunlia imazamoxiresistens TaxID=3127457 RepID=UPI0030177BBD